MEDQDVNRILKNIAKQAEQAREEQLAEEKAREREAIRYAKAVSKQEVTDKTQQKDIASYTAVIIARLEYKSGDAPDTKQLAEDLKQTINKWVNQKGFTGIDPREPVPTLVSLDVDIQ